MSGKQMKKREKYRKIPLKIKVLLLKKIIQEGQSIKKVAAEFKINYSTAKTLYRNEKLQKNKNSLAQLVKMNDEGSQLIPTSNESHFKECGYIYIAQMLENMPNNLKVDEYEEKRKPTQIQIVSKVLFPNIF